MNDTVVLDAPPATSTGTGTAAESAQVAHAHDQPEATTASTGVPAESTPTAADEFAEFQADVQKSVGEKPADAESKDDPIAAAGETNDPDESADAAGDVPDPDALSQNQGKVPEKLTDRPEWKQLTAIADKVGKEAGREVRAVLRGMFKAQYDLNQKVESAKPAQAVVQEMLTSVGGSAQGFNNMRHLIRSFDRSPAEAIPMLEQLLHDAKSRAGLVLQSPELLAEAKQIDQDVADGLVERAAGERRKQELLELEQHRAGARRQAAREQGEQQRHSQAQQQQAVNELNSLESGWTADKQKSDPDFAAVEKLHRLFIQQNVAEFSERQRRWPNAKEAVALLERSYQQAKAEALKFKPSPRARQAVRSGEGSSLETRQQPATELDEFKADVERAFKRNR